MKSLVDTQREYFNSNVTKPLGFRLAMLEQLQDILRKNQPTLDTAIRQDFGKQRFENLLTELYVVHDDINSAIENLSAWATRKPVATNILNEPATCYIVPEPLGVSLIIGPWNYPYQLTLAPVVAAIAAGCTAIIKPSELTAHCSSLMAQLINERFDPDYLLVLEGGIPETTALLEQQFDKIFFTGSVQVGKIVYQAAAKNLTPVTLELGGKSPVIIMDDADLTLTVKRLVWGKFLNSGQTCIAPDYVYVHQSIESAFIKQLKAEIDLRDYRLDNGNLVQIINDCNLQRLANLIDPVKVVHGGEVDVLRRVITPTVLAGMSWEDKAMQEEIFGPILPVLTFDALSDVIRVIKAHPKPLALYLFTKSEETKTQVLSEVSFGGGCVNDTIMHISVGDLPFGGVGDSGIGSYHGEEGFRSFSHFKSVLEKPFLPEPEIKFSPYTEERVQVMESLLNN